MQINSISNNQNFGLKLPLGMERTLWWKMANFPVGDSERLARKLYRHLRITGSPSSKLKDISFDLTDLDNGQKELFTSINLKVGKLFDRSTEFETLTQQSGEPFTLQHLKDAFSTMIAKIERAYVKSRTFMAAGERIQEGKPLIQNKDFLADLKKIDKAIPGYAEYKRKLFDVVTSAEGLIR